MGNIKAILSLQRRGHFGNIIKHLRIPKIHILNPSKECTICWSCCVQ